MKTKEELNTLKEEIEIKNKKLQELADRIREEDLSRRNTERGIIPIRIISNNTI